VSDVTNHFLLLASGGLHIVMSEVVQ
jgi:hypothetical protein